MPFVQAQQAGEETKLAANKEAEAVISKAQAQADLIVNDAIEKHVIYHSKLKI